MSSVITPVKVVVAAIAGIAQTAVRIIEHANSFFIVLSLVICPS
jgi:hypothetical protein